MFTQSLYVLRLKDISRSLISCAGATSSVCIRASSRPRRSWWPSSRRSPAASRPTSSCPRDRSSTATSWRYQSVWGPAWRSRCSDQIGSSDRPLLSFEGNSWREALLQAHGLVSPLQVPPQGFCLLCEYWEDKEPNLLWKSFLVLVRLFFTCCYFCCQDKKQTLQTASPHHGGSQGCGEGHRPPVGDPTRVWNIWQEEVRPDPHFSAVNNCLVWPEIWKWLSTSCGSHSVLIEIEMLFTPATMIWYLVKYVGFFFIVMSKLLWSGVWEGCREHQLQNSPRPLRHF